MASLKCRSMRYSTPWRWLGAAVAACAMAWAGGVRADAGDAFNFSIGQSVLRDDNVFRLAPDANAQRLLGAASRGDNISTTSAALRFDRPVALQRLYANLGVSRVRYGRFTHLDHDSQNLSAGWDWALGSHWRGTFAWSRNEALSDFGEIRSTGKNIATYERASFSAGYQFHPEWTAGAVVFRNTGDNSSAARATATFEANGAEAFLEHATGRGSAIALLARRTDADYPNQEAVNSGLVDNSYRQDEIEARGAYRAGGASRFDLRLAQVWRKHEQAPARDFAGASGKLSWDWQLNGKSALNVSAWREIGARGDVLASYVVTRAISVLPSWQPTPKTLLQLGLERLALDYRGDPVAILSGIEKREDRLRLWSFSAGYSPITNLQLSLSLRRERRASNYAGMPYRANGATLSAQFDF